jgi:uncharacterized cupin superfamily protein
VKRVNLFTAETEFDADDHDGFKAGMHRFGPSLDAALIGGTIYDLPPGQSNCPYHYEYGCEEWVIVVAGRLTLRHSEGEDVLEPGDVAVFPEGPAGAHRLTNAHDEPCRVLMLSTKGEPAVAVYPDSDKIGVWPGGDRDKIMVRRASNVDYWDGEIET